MTPRDPYAWINPWDYIDGDLAPKVDIPTLRKLAGKGLGRAELARQLGCTVNWVSILAHRHGIDFSGSRKGGAARKRAQPTQPPSPPRLFSWQKEGEGVSTSPLKS